MTEKSEIKLRRYNFDTKKLEDIGTVSVYDIVRSMNIPQFVYLLSEWLNVGMKNGFSEGKEVGIDFHKEHRTIQGCIYRFCLGVIVGLSGQQYTDARNEIAVKNAKKIAEMIEVGDIELGWLI